MDSKTSKFLAIGFFAVVGGIVTTAVYRAFRGKKSPENTTTKSATAATPKPKSADVSEVESTLNKVWEKALEGKEEEAKGMLETLMAKYPTNFAPYASYAEIAQILTPEFIEKARKAASSEYEKILVEIFDATSKYDFETTTTLVEEALKKYPNNTTLLLMRIPLSVIQKRIFDAREDCDKILENKTLNKFERSRVYHLKAGTLGQSTEEIPEAIQFLNKSLEEFPNNLSALIDRSTMYLMDEKTANKASQDAKRALQINDSNAQVHVHNSRVVFALQAAQGNPAALESVIKSLEKALSLDSGSIEALTELGNAKYLMGKIDDLETAINTFTADPKNAGKEYPHSLKALVLLLAGKFEEAKTLATERIEALSKKDQKREYLFALQTQDPTLMDIEGGIQSYKTIARYASSYLYVFEKIPEFKVMIEKRTDEPEFQNIQFNPAKMEVFTKEEDTQWGALIDSMWLLIMSQIPFLNSTPELLKMVDEFKGFLKSSFKLKYLTTNAEIIMAAIEAFQSQQARPLKSAWELMFTQAKKENIDPRQIILKQIKQMKAAMQGESADELDVE